MAAEPEEIPANIAAAITEISERATLLIRDEVELARAEIGAKVGKLAAGVFVAIAMLFVLIGLAWLAWFELFPANQFFWGFFVVAGLLLVLGVLAGWLAARALRRGSPPSPTMAIDEARKIREAVGPREDVA